MGAGWPRGAAPGFQEGCPRGCSVTAKWGLVQALPPLTGPFSSIASFLPGAGGDSATASVSLREGKGDKVPLVQVQKAEKASSGEESTPERRA